MELRQRLTSCGARRCPQTTAAPPTFHPPDSVEERLQRCVVRLRRGTPPQSRRARGRASPGERVAEGLIVIERRIPLSHQHGKDPLTPITTLASPQAPGRPGSPGRAARVSGHRGPPAWRVVPAHRGFLLGVGRIDGDELHLRQFFLTGFRGEAALLQEAAAWTAGRPYLVTFNGKSFDVPLLATRYRLARLPDPFAALHQVDLFHPTRRAFSSQWPDCRLQTAEKHLLGFQRVHDLPAHLVPETWFAFVRRGATHHAPDLLAQSLGLVSLVALLPAHGGRFSASERVPMWWPLRGTGVCGATRALRWPICRRTNDSSIPAAYSIWPCCTSAVNSGTSRCRSGSVSPSASACQRLSI